MPSTKADIILAVSADTSKAKSQIKALANESGSDNSSSTSEKSSKKEKDTSLAGPIAKMVAGQVATKGVQAIGNIIGNQPGQSRTGQRVSTIGGGIASGAMSGALVGGPIGAAIGAAAGGLIATFNQLSSEAKAVRDTLHDISSVQTDARRGYAMQKQDKDFNFLLGTMSKSSQTKAINNRIDQLQSGDGEFSIDNLQNKLSSLTRRGKTDTNEYKDTSKIYTQQVSRLTNLLSKRDDLALQTPGKWQEANMYGDSIGAMGGSVGAQVNVVDVNRQQLDTLKLIYEAIRASGSADVSQKKPIEINMYN